MMARSSLTPRVRDSHGLLKVESVRTASPRLLLQKLFPPVHQDGLRTSQLHINSKVFRRVLRSGEDPSQEFP